MAWTEQDLREIEDELKKDSQGVGDVPEAESLDGITSLPAYQEKDGEDIIVRAPLELLAAPALEAADKANEAANKAESNATAAQTAANTANEKAELAAQAASDVNAAKEGAETATQSANNAASNANEKAVLADTAAANANDTAEHPTYIGQDHYVYKWNKTAQAYDKTDIYTKGDAFSIKKVYASVANMEADKSNPDITEGDFVLVNTGDVEDPDNAKLYVKADGDFEFLVDMSGAIGFTGKTPQFSIGTISTLEAGSTATATISEDGVDSDGNPKYKINFAIPRGNPGAPFRVTGEYATLEALKSAVPDGSTIDGFMAVGTEAPYDYYAWVNGDWVNQGKIAGGGSGNVVIVPIMGLTTQSTSDEIFNAFGGKQNLIDIIKKVKDEDCVVIAKTDDDPNAVVQQTFSVVNATYVNDNNLILGLISWSVNVTSQMIIQVIDGVASYNEISTPLMTEAPSDGNVYGRKNKDWVEVPENSNVISLPSALLKLKGQSNSSEILSVFGGLDALRTTIAKLRSDNYIIMCGDKNGNYSYVFDDYHVSYTDENNFKLSLFDISGSSSVNANFLYMIVSLVDGVAEISSKREYSLVKDTDVLTKTNTSPFTPTQPYHPATKKYVDDKVYIVNNSTWEEVLRNNKSINGTDVQALVNKLFGSYSAYLSLLQGVNDNVYIGLKFTDWTYDDIDGYGTGSSYTASNLYVKHNTAEGEFNCNFTYFYKNALKCCIINVNEASNHNYDKLIIQDIVASDNLSTITKKTAAEYEALGSKDANTAYCVTD